MRISRQARLLIPSMLIPLLVFSSLAPALPAYGHKDLKVPALFGPRIDEILYKVILTADARRIALKNGEVDIYDGIVSPAILEDLAKDPNVDVRISPQFHFFYLGFNFRRAPLDNKVLRQAMAHVVPKEDLSRTLFRGITTPTDTPVAPVSGPLWYNPNVKKYPYNLDEARRILDANGWRLDPATNLRIDPSTGNVMRQLEILTPTIEEAATSAEIGRRIAEEAQKVGLNVVAKPTQFLSILELLDSLGPFDMWTLAFGRIEPWDIYQLFHSSFAIPGGNNVAGIASPKLDALLEAVRFGADREAAQVAAKEAQLLISEELPYVTIYTRLIVDGWRKGWEGVWLYPFDTTFNGFTLGNVHKEGKEIGGTLSFALSPDIRNPNPVFASAGNEQDVWNNIYESLIGVDPLDPIGKETPGLAKSWQVGRWSPAPGKEGLLLSFELEDGIVWQDGRPFSAEDVVFSILFFRDLPVPLYLDSVQDVVDVRAVGNRIEVFLNTTSWLRVREVGGLTILPKHIWGRFKTFADARAFRPAEEAHPTVPGLTQLIGTGAFVFKERKPGEFVRLVWNPLYWSNLGERVAKLSISAPSQVTIGEDFTARATLADPTGKAVDNARAVFVVFDKATKALIGRFEGRGTGGGSYEAKIQSAVIGSGERTVKAAFLWEDKGVTYLIGATPQEVGGTLPRNLLYIRDPASEAIATVVAIPEVFKILSQTLEARIDTLTSQLRDANTQAASLQTSVNDLNRKLQEAESRATTQLYSGLGIVLVVAVAAGFVLSRRTKAT